MYPSFQKLAINIRNITSSNVIELLKRHPVLSSNTYSLIKNLNNMSQPLLRMVPYQGVSIPNSLVLVLFNSYVFHVHQYTTNKQKNNKLCGLSLRENYTGQSDRHFSTKLMPTFADRGVSLCQCSTNFADKWRSVWSV
jgi:hypothetical protein